MQHSEDPFITYCLTLSFILFCAFPLPMYFKDTFMDRGQHSLYFSLGHIHFQHTFWTICHATGVEEDPVVTQNIQCLW